MPYIPFTDEQKVLANSVDLEEFLRMRGEKLERVGREHKLIYYDGSGKHDSITLRGSTWFDHKNQVGGGAIKFMQEFYDMDFQTAVQELLGQTITPLSHSPPKAIAKEEKKEFRLPEANANMHRVYAYLIKQRFIDPNIISHFAKQHTLYEDKEHHNAVFVGVDENGVPRQAHKRSTNSFGNAFRITCEGSDTRYSFSHFGKSEKLFVFEAPIDMMSFLTLYPTGWQRQSYIAMTGTCTSPNIPSELFLNTGIFTIESVGANMAEITRIIPMAEAVPNIALAEILLPILAPIRRPTNISNQYVAVTEPAMASAPAPFTPNTSKSGFCNHLFNTLGTPTSIPT